MRIPLITRMQVEQVPAEHREWVSKLLTPLNTFIGSVAPALTNRLTFLENLLGQEQLLDFVWNGTNLPVLFKITISATPLELRVCSATENLSTPVSLVLAWGINQQGQVQITDISKISNGTVTTLVSGARYQIRVRISP